MKNEMFIKPNGVKVRNPLTMQYLSTSGETVARNSYWIRRLNDGDVVIAKTSKPIKK